MITHKLPCGTIRTATIKFARSRRCWLKAASQLSGTRVRSIGVGAGHGWGLVYITLLASTSYTIYAA